MGERERESADCPYSMQGLTCFRLLNSSLPCAEVDSTIYRKIIEGKLKKKIYEFKMGHFRRIWEDEP